jgi:regulator of Ty1 transposition protein 109
MPSAPAAPTPPSSKVPKKKPKKKLTGRIAPRAPKIKTRARNYLTDRPSATAYYYWPPEGRGNRIVDEAEYKRIVELLLHLDFSTLDKAVGSSRRWLNEVGMGEGTEEGVVGRAFPTSLRAKGDAPGAATGANGDVANLTGLVRRKNPHRPLEGDSDQRARSPPEVPAGPAAEPPIKQINVLGSSLVRKKKKGAEAGVVAVPSSQ